MIIKKIKFKNFKTFRTGEFDFTKMNFIKGRNGSGKTTLALESILFALYGYTIKDTLKDLPTREVSKSCTVDIMLSQNEKEYNIIRHYPTKLIIKENGQDLNFNTGSEAQSFIIKTFGDRLYFSKFRIIDTKTKEANFLEEGNVALKKILFSVSDKVFNDIKDKLNNIKHEREILNKDKAVIYPYYPSEKRLKTIISGLTEVNNRYSQIRTDINDIRRGTIEDERNKSQLVEKQRTFTKAEQALKISHQCYACHQELPKDRQKQMLENLGAEIQELEKSLPQIEENIQMGMEIIQSYEGRLDISQKKLSKLNNLKTKLEGRVEQKEYIYTEKDILIVKKGIEELDRLSTYYLTESVKILKPLVNSVLEKIGFKVDFEVNGKGKFAIIMEKEGVKYTHKDLSTGEKLILQIAFKLALLLERGESGMVIADEGLSSLDEKNLLHILKIFDTLPFQLFLVLHNFNNVPSTLKVIDLDEVDND